MWEHGDHKLALLELFLRGRLRRRTGQEDAWAWLAELPWVRRSGRRDELALVDGRAAELEALLDRAWPSWRAAATALEDRSLPPTPDGWRKLADLRRSEDVGSLPKRVNRRTAAAKVAPHSKASLGARRIAALGDTEVTHDGVLRLRPSSGLVLRRGDQALEADRVARVLGEIALTDRALRDGVRLEGPIRAVLLVENLGAYLDLEAPEGWVIAHVPGWDTATVRAFLDGLRDVPVVHFGDLDPNGVLIVEHLRRLRPELLWAVPEFWGEYVAERGLARSWPEELMLEGLPALVRELAARGLWLEQECIVLDERLGQWLSELVSRDHHVRHES